jgi:hypothetical protein
MELLRAEFILSGEFDRVATGMSWRIAAYADRAGPLPLPTEAVDTQLQKFYERVGVTPPTLDEALRGIGRDRSWLDTLLRIEAVYQDCRRTVISDQHRQRALPSLRLGLIRVEFESTTAPNLDAAREAALCLSEEEMTIEELAEECGSEVQRETIFLEDVPEETQQAFMCARIGGVLEPYVCDEGASVTRVVQRIEPDLSDDEVRTRVDDRLLSAYFEELTGKQIKMVLV